MLTTDQNYGVGANSYRAAGELAGITNLVNTFYTNMDNFKAATTIRKMHAADWQLSRQKLIYFLPSASGRL